MKRRAIPAISLALVVLFSASFLLALPGAVSMPASAVTQAEIDALKESAGELEQQQKEIQAQLNAIAADKDEALEQKSLLEQQINVIQSEINNIDAQIAKYDELISQKEDELAQLEQQEAEQYQLFCERVRYMEEEGEVSYWAILFNAEDFSDMLDRFMMVEEIMAYDNAIMDELLATQAQIEQEKAELEEARTAQEEARQKQADAKARLKSQQAEVDALISQISSQEDELEAMEAKLQAAAKAMDNEIARKERELQAQLAREGIGPLLEELRQVDPEAARRLHPADEKRILRALEVYRETGKTITEHNRETAALPPRYDAVWIGLQFEERAEMKALIDRRVDAMVETGLVAEVEGLLDRGFREGVTAPQAIGYKEIVEALDGFISLDEAVERIKLATRRYAKRQRTWFRKDARIRWLDATSRDIPSLVEEALELLDDGVA